MAGGGAHCAAASPLCDHRRLDSRGAEHACSDRIDVTKVDHE
jgi:hypothetical protein